MKINEEILSFIWQHQLIEPKHLECTKGEKIIVSNQGLINKNSGPDFKNAKLKIGISEWYGSVEIHIKSSQWNLHGHQNDDAYKGVILHVVYEDDMPLNNVPTLELKGKIDPWYFSFYQELMERKSFVACEQNLKSIDKKTLPIFKSRLLIERLVEKNNYINQILKNNTHDWEATLYKVLLSSFGFSVNKYAFEQLSEKLDWSILKKYTSNIDQLETLLFGTAGWLDEEYKDEYLRQLSKEWSFLQKKHNIQSLPKSIWQLSRMRPSNFPTIRIAQIATLLHHEPRLFHQLIELKKPEQLHLIFSKKTTTYWQSHYLPEKESKTKSKGKLGKASIDILLINSVAPILFTYGKNMNQNEYIDAGIELLENIKPETNSIINNWKKLGFEIKNAADSQALLFLKKNMCNHKKCLDCAIGIRLFKKIQK